MRRVKCLGRQCYCRGLLRQVGRRRRRGQLARLGGRLRGKLVVGGLCGTEKGISRYQSLRLKRKERSEEASRRRFQAVLWVISIETKCRVSYEECQWSRQNDLRVQVCVKELQNQISEQIPRSKPTWSYIIDLPWMYVLIDSCCTRNDTISRRVN